MLPIWMKRPRPAARMAGSSARVSRNGASPLSVDLQVFGNQSMKQNATFTTFSPGAAEFILTDGDSLKVENVGFFDDDPNATLAKRLYLPCLGRLDDASRLAGPRWVIALGGLAARRSLLTRMAAFPDQSRAVTIVNPSAVVSASAEIGAGTLIAPRALVHCFARVGDHSIINTGAIVEHECEIGENAHVAPGATLGGNVSVGADTLVGIGAAVLPGVRIGARCVIGAGATVVRNVPDGATVVGTPADATHPGRRTDMRAM